MRVCICGGGIAGLTLAWWLAADDHEVVLVERSRGLRTEGYMIDFFGSGWDVAEKMGLLERLEAIHYPIEELAFVREDGSERVSVPYVQLRRLFDNRHFNFMRGDLERVLYEALPKSVQVRFGTGVASFDDGERLTVELTDGTREGFDLLVGADGVHSNVRELALGQGDDALKFLGFYSAAYVIDDPGIYEELGDAFRTLTVPGRQVGVYPIRGRRLATFLVHDESHHVAGQRTGEMLRAVYGDVGWVVPTLLEECPADEDIFFDTVSQVQLNSWSRGRVTLVGDACQAVSLLAGQGASMAMGGAWALATSIREAGDNALPQALQRYEERVRPAIEHKQKAGQRMANWFVPQSRTKIGLRDRMLALSAKPGMSWIMKGVVSGDSIVSGPDD